MDKPTPDVIAADFKDRRGGLIAFGIVLILVGCGCLLLAAGMLMAQGWVQDAASGLGPHSARFAGNDRSIIPVAFIYAGLAVVFVWLGIGSIRARRWARPLVLTLSWTWLATGVISVATAAMFLPRMLTTAMPSGSAPMPAGIVTTVAALTTGCLGVFLVLLPAALVLFYRSRHVKATCEARDPVVRWTDACPPPVLGLSVALGVGALCFPLMMAMNAPVFPFFGMLLGGAPATAAMLVTAAAWGYCAWAAYKMKPGGWWAIVTVFAVNTVSAFLTFSRVDLLEMYRMMNYPEEQIAQIEQAGFLANRGMLVLIAFWTVVMSGYLLYVRKYFRETSVETPRGSM